MSSRKGQRELLAHQRARRIIHVSAPRLHMSLIVLLTAASGFLSSVLLLSAGMHAMALRYGCSVLVAYAVFLLLMAIWRRWREWDISLELPGGGGRTPADWHGDGGMSGGGGASASFDAPSPVTPSLDAPGVEAASVDADIDIGDGIWVLPFILLAGGLLVAAAWVVWIAPTLLAEVALDAALSAGLYRRLRHSPVEDWFFATLRHTWKPFVLAMFCALVIGGVMDYTAPQANTLGEVFTRS